MIGFDALIQPESRREDIPRRQRPEKRAPSDGPHQARSLLALRQEIRERKEPILMNSLKRVGLVGENSTLDDVLNLQVTDLLSRRLQTIVMKNFGFKTPYQARQAVVHGHIMIGDRIIDIPSYVVKVNEEKDVKLVPNSSLKELLEKAQKESEAVSEEVSEETVTEEAPSKTEEVPIKEVKTEESSTEKSAE